MNSRKDNWDKAQIIGFILIPFVIGIWGYFINDNIKEKEIRLQYLDMALNILSQEPSKDADGMRLWAIDVVEEFAIIQFSDEALKELKRSAFPFRKMLLDSEGKMLRSADGKEIFTKK